MVIGNDTYARYSLNILLSGINLLILVFVVWPLFIEDWQAWWDGRFLAGIIVFFLALPAAATPLALSGLLPYKRGWHWFRRYFIAVHFLLNLVSLWLFFFMEMEPFPFWLLITALFSWLSLRRLKREYVDGIILFNNVLIFLILVGVFWWTLII